MYETNSEAAGEPSPPAIAASQGSHEQVAAEAETANAGHTSEDGGGSRAPRRWKKVMSRGFGEVIVVQNAILRYTAVESVMKLIAKHSSLKMRLYQQACNYGLNCISCGIFIRLSRSTEIDGLYHRATLSKRSPRTDQPPAADNPPTEASEAAVSQQQVMHAIESEAILARTIEMLAEASSPRALASDAAAPPTPLATASDALEERARIGSQVDGTPYRSPRGFSTSVGAVYMKNAPRPSEIAKALAPVNSSNGSSTNGRKGDAAMGGTSSGQTSGRGARNNSANPDVAEELTDTSAIAKSMEAVRQLHSTIIEGLSTLQHTTTKLINEQEEQYRRQFRAHLQELLEESARATQQQKPPIEVSRLQQSLLREMQNAQEIAKDLEEHNWSLQKENKDLKLKLECEREQGKLLAKEVVMIKKKLEAEKNAVCQLQEKLGALQRHRELKGAGVSEGEASEAAQEPLVTSREKRRNKLFEREVKFREEIQRLQRITTIQKKELHHLRGNLNKAGAVRNEIAAFLHEAMNDVAAKVAGCRKMSASKFSINYHSPRESRTELTTADREQVLEKFLAQERVVQLLNDLMGPASPAEKANAPSRDAHSASFLNQHSEGGSRNLDSVLRI